MAEREGFELEALARRLSRTPKSRAQRGTLNYMAGINGRFPNFSVYDFAVFYPARHCRRGDWMNTIQKYGI